MSDILQMLITAMSPILEVRGAILLAIANGISPIEAYFVCVIGNMIPIPFLILLARKVLHWLKNFSGISHLAERLERRAHRRSEQMKKGAFWGLLILVAIPLPGTGAWTGALVASILGLRLRSSIPAIFLGVLIAGLIVLGISCGVIAIF